MSCSSPFPHGSSAGTHSSLCWRLRRILVLLPSWPWPCRWISGSCSPSCWPGSTFLPRKPCGSFGRHPRRSGGASWISLLHFYWRSPGRAMSQGLEEIHLLGVQQDYHSKQPWEWKCWLFWGPAPHPFLAVQLGSQGPPGAQLLHPPQAAAPPKLLEGLHHPQQHPGDTPDNPDLPWELVLPQAASQAELGAGV